MELPKKRALGEDLELPEKWALGEHLEFVPINEPCTKEAKHKRTPSEVPGHEWAGSGRKALSRVNRFHVALMLAAVLSIVTVCLALYIVVERRCADDQQKLKECVQSGAVKAGKDGEVLPPCGDDSIWYQGKCYYFSDDAGTWTVAKDSCAAVNSSLALIKTQKELDFMLHRKGDQDRWIGLKRDNDTQPWIWVNGTELNKWYLLMFHSLLVSVFYLMFFIYVVASSSSLEFRLLSTLSSGVAVLPLVCLF